MATPTGITLQSFDLIVELSDDIQVNTSSDKTFGGGYVRQVGTLVTSCSVGDFIQFNSKDCPVFQQTGVTYQKVKDSQVYFIQAPPV